MTKVKRPLGIIIISIGAFIYALLDIGQLFMPTTTQTRIEYNFPIIGLLLLIFGVGLLLLKEWARKGMIIASILAIVLSSPGLLQSSPVNIISFVVTIIFGLLIYYFMRASVKSCMS
jgi:hypothetical protein